jgi:hypothetical protein
MAVWRKIAPDRIKNQPADLSRSDAGWLFSVDSLQPIA